MGYTPDIGIYYSFEWYYWVYYLNPLDNETRLAEWLGPAPDYGAADGFLLLPISPNPIVSSTVWEIPADDSNTDIWKAEMNKFLEVIDAILETDRLTKSMNCY